MKMASIEWNLFQYHPAENLLFVIASLWSISDVQRSSYNIYCTSNNELYAEAAVPIDFELPIAPSSTAPKLTLKQKHDSPPRRTALAATSFIRKIACFNGILNYTTRWSVILLNPGCTKATHTHRGHAFHARATLRVHGATCVLFAACTDGHRRCQSNDDSEEGEMHYGAR